MPYASQQPNMLLQSRIYRSSHAAKIDPALNTAYMAITECLKSTRANDLLSGIVPPCITHEALSQKEKLKQERVPHHHLFDQEPAEKR